MPYRYRLKGLYSKRELFFYIALSLCIISGAAYQYLVQISADQRKSDTAIAEQVLTRIAGEIGKATGVMSSLASVQQVLDDPFGDKLDLFASKALAQSPLLKSVSRYERVESTNLSYFMEEMSDSILYNFSIKSLDENGRKTPVTAKNVYYPLIWRQPYGPRAAALIGVDLADSQGLASAIQASETANAINAMTVPHNWRLSETSDLLLVQPSYFGRFAPEGSDKLASQSNGGVIVGMGLGEFIENNNLLDENFEISVSLVDSESDLNSETTLKTIRTDSTESVYLSSIFYGVKVSVVPILGTHALKITVATDGGISSSGLAKAAFIAVVTMFILALIFGVAYKLRFQESVRKRERESALVTLRAIGDAVITTNSDGVITYANPSSEVILSVKSQELIGKPIGNVVKFSQFDNQDTNSSSADYSLHDLIGSSNKLRLPELQIYNSGNDLVTVSSTLSPMRGDNSSNGGYVLVMRDVTAERELTRELEFLATHDSLTEIANRYYFEKLFKTLIESSLSHGEQHAICYIDLDQFKTINDTCGHSAGDQLLRRVSSDLQTITRREDVLARLGGDEFGLLMTNCDEESAITLAKRIYEYFQTMYFQHNDDVFAVRASIGFVHISGQFESTEEVMAAADLACYSAKDRGRNELYIFNQDNDETADRRSEMMWLPKLQMALRCDNFRLFVQPIVDITASNSTASFTHYEILLRLETEEGKLITPMQLIVAAERYNLMRDIDRWVINKAIDTIAKLSIELGRYIPTFSINISGQSSVDKELPDFLRNKINSAGINPSKLVFEITETSAITNMQAATEFVEALHTIGCKLALDDFGSGMSSFGYLKSLPVDYLKIDGQFIKNIHTSEVDREMVRCMQTVADILGIETVAEYVENEEIVEVIRELNIGYAQGYHYSKPLPIESLFKQEPQSKAACIPFPIESLFKQDPQSKAA